MAPWIALAGFGFVFSPVARSATLLLAGPGGSPGLPSSHADLYYFPKEALDGIPTFGSIISVKATLVGTSTPLMALNANPGGLPTPIRDPMLLGADLDNDTHLLFVSSQIQSVTDVIETSDTFSATVTFVEPIDGGPLGAPALRSVNSDAHGLTSLEWEVVYSSGTTRTFYDGIIPEPSVAGLSALALSVFAFRRRRSI